MVLVCFIMFSLLRFWFVVFPEFYLYPLLVSFTMFLQFSDFDLLCSLNFSYTFCCSQILILCFPWCWSWFKKLLFLRFWCCVSLNCAFLNWCYFDASVFHDCFWNVLISMHFSVTYIYIYVFIIMMYIFVCVLFWFGSPCEF
jgi:hypothetical protein